MMLSCVHRADLLNDGVGVLALAGGQTSESRAVVLQRKLLLSLHLKVLLTTVGSVRYVCL